MKTNLCEDVIEIIMSTLWELATFDLASYHCYYADDVLFSPRHVLFLITNIGEFYELFYSLLYSRLFEQLFRGPMTNDDKCHDSRDF